MQCLTKYLIQTADGPAYRSGNLDGMRHPVVDGKMIRAAGGMKKLIEEADELETDRSDPDGAERIWEPISCGSIIRSARCRSSAGAPVWKIPGKGS